MELIGQDVYISKIKKALLGQGNLKVNSYIRKLNDILWDKYRIGIKEIYDDFRGHFFLNQLHKKYDPEKGSIGLYITYQAFYYLSDELKKLKRINEREKELEDLIKNDTEIRRQVGFWLAPEKIKTPEENYMKNELFQIMRKFFTENCYDGIYLDIMMGYLNKTEVAYELEIHRNTVANNLRKITDEMIEYLKEYEYTQQDLREILERDF